MADRLVVDCTADVTSSIPLTQAEQDDLTTLGGVVQVQAQQASTSATNRTTLTQKASAALTSNASFQAIASPTSAQIAAQVQALTKQSNGIIRLLIGALDSSAT